MAFGRRNNYKCVCFALRWRAHSFGRARSLSLPFASIINIIHLFVRNENPVAFSPRLDEQMSARERSCVCVCVYFACAHMPSRFRSCRHTYVVHSRQKAYATSPRCCTSIEKVKCKELQVKVDISIHIHVCVVDVCAHTRTQRHTHARTHTMKMGREHVKHPTRQQQWQKKGENIIKDERNEQT